MVEGNVNEAMMELTLSLAEYNFSRSIESGGLFYVVHLRIGGTPVYLNEFLDKVMEV